MDTVLLDVNVIVSAIIAPLGTVRKILTYWQRERFEIIISDLIVVEVEEKLRDPKIGGLYHIAEDEVVSVRNLLLTQGKTIPVRPQDVISVTSDPEDDYVLATAALGKPKYLVTGDKKLLGMKSYSGIKIIAPKSWIWIMFKK